MSWQGKDQDHPQDGRPTFTVMVATIANGMLCSRAVARGMCMTSMVAPECRGAIVVRVRSHLTLLIAAAMFGNLDPSSAIDRGMSAKFPFK
jgi:hypothetical protein